jgi:hypothetical protein
VTTFTTEDINSLKTDWFPADINPVYDGNYEVELDSWPWPTMIEWSNKRGWEVGDSSLIKRWRGLKEKVE